MASQVQAVNLQAGASAEAASGSRNNLMKLCRTSLERAHAGPATKGELADRWTPPQIFAHTVEFVALPGKTEKLCKEIPLAMRQANGKSESFSGCMVLISEEEVRLVTVITLWMERDSLKERDEKLDQLKKLVAPYIDRMLRTRRFVSLLSVP